MKKVFICVMMVLLLCLTFVACGPKDYVLNEKNFFIAMTNIQNRPQQYVDSTLEFDCFTYELVDVVNNTSYICGVRKCAQGFGCKCGKDTIIGFVLEYNGALPEPRNQSEDTNDKTWVHLKGQIKSADKISIVVNSYTDGVLDPDNTETIQFLKFVVESCDVIQDYSNLNYYVS